MGDGTGARGGVESDSGTTGRIPCYITLVLLWCPPPRTLYLERQSEGEGTVPIGRRGEGGAGTAVGSITDRGEGIPPARPEDGGIAWAASRARRSKDVRLGSARDPAGRRIRLLF